MLPATFDPRDHGGVVAAAGFADGGEPGRDNALANLEITEADLVASGPRVRALQVARLEAIWRVVNARIQLDDDAERPIDPRILEIGLRVIKEEAMMYRLGRTPPATGEDEDEGDRVGQDRVSLIETHLAEIEAKLREQPS